MADEMAGADDVAEGGSTTLGRWPGPRTFGAIAAATIAMPLGLIVANTMEPISTRSEALVVLAAAISAGLAGAALVALSIRRPFWGILVTAFATAAIGAVLFPWTWAFDSDPIRLYRGFISAPAVLILDPILGISIVAGASAWVVALRVIGPIMLEDGVLDRIRQRASGRFDSRLIATVIVSFVGWCVIGGIVIAYTVSHTDWGY